MKAVLYTRYGSPDVLQLQDVEKPVPKDDEVLVQVHATSVNALEWRRFTMPRIFARMFGRGLFRPKDKSIGADVAGRVEAVGSKVNQFRPGDEVYGVRRGAFAQYVCAPEKSLALKPANLSFEAAAAVPLAALTALQGLRAGEIQPGQQVLINGAGGGAGTFAVQIAKSFGTEVTAACSARNLAVARSLGADRVVDYAREDCTRGSQLYDLILGVNGYHPLWDYRRALKPNGAYVMIGGSAGQLLHGMLLAPLYSRTGNKKFRGVMTQLNEKDLLFLKELIEAGKVRPVIDRTYALADAADAIRYLMAGHSGGKVVITVDQ